MRTLKTLVLAFLSITLIGCGDSHEKVASDTKSEMNKFAEIVKGITDKKTAEEALPKFKAWAKAMKDLGERGKALEKPSDEEAKKFVEDMKEAVNAMIKAGLSLAKKAKEDPEIKKVIESIEGEMNEIMKGHQAPKVKLPFNLP